MQRSHMIGLLLLAFAPATAGAAIWRVERDGSGDFTTIQPAIDAASPGDVIEIGPGRYPEFTEIPIGSITVRTSMHIVTNDLTVRGTDRDAVILGPETGPYIPYSTGTFPDIPRFTIENVTIENMEDGVSAGRDYITVRNCRISNCDIGVNSLSLLQTLVEDCIFENNDNVGVIVFDALNSTGVEILRSVFRGNRTGIDLQTSENLVEECEFYGGVIGIQFSSAATGLIQGCYFENSERGIVGTDNARCDILGNTILGGEANLILTNWSHAVGTDNVFSGGSFSTLLLSHGSTAELSGCHILSGGYPWRVKAQSSGAPIEIDLRNNYWGTTDTAEIAESILDSNDAETITATVLFEPFAEQPISTESTSFSTLKARFGPHQD